MIEIKTTRGDVRLKLDNIGEGSKRRYELMKEDYITLKFSLAEPVVFRLGDYVELDGKGRFEVTDVQSPTYNASTGGWDYELKLNAEYWKWKNKILKYTPETGGQEASWSLTASLTAQAKRVVANLKKLGYKHNGKDYVAVVDESVGTDSRLMTYDNTSILDACNAIAEEWECDFWVEGNKIHFGRLETGTPVDLELGKNVSKMTRSDSSSDYATRVYAFGSTRNLPKDYRKNTATSEVMNGISERRLMIPESEGKTYIDAYADMSEEEAVEAVVTFDDIYPRRVGEIGEVTEIKKKVTDEDTGEETEEEVTFYRFKDSDSNFLFKKEYLLDGEDLMVVFQSGALNGMEFALAFDPDGKGEQLYEIVRNDTYGAYLPNKTLKPAKGDKYVLYNWDSSKIAELGLVDAAEKELLEKAKQYVEKSKIDPSTYSVTMMPDYMYGLDESGNLDKTRAKHFAVGDKVKLISKAFFKDGSRKSRVIGIEYPLDIPYDSPVLTVGEKGSYSLLKDIEDRAKKNAEGVQGVPGRDGKTGKTTYTWIRYADDAEGNGISNDPTGKKYIGFAYNKSTPEESDYAPDYKWSRIEGEPGTDGKDGSDGTSVTITEQSVQYATGDSGETPPATGWTDSIPAVPKGAYLWTRTAVTYSDGQKTESYAVAYSGKDGAQGPQGVPGKDGTSVTVTKTETKYTVTSSSSKPADNNFTYTSVPSVSKGQYLWSRQTVTFSDGKTLTSYSVSRIGTDGKNGTAGAKGKDGKTTYLHIAYASSSDGKTGFKTTYFTNAAYIGTCTDYSSADPTTYGSYTWARLRGDTGAKGDKGDKGDKGNQGVKGEKGDDGTQYWTWIAYSDNADGSGMYQTPTDTTRYIGIAVNKTTGTESTNPKDYTWSLFRGEKGDPGGYKRHPLTIGAVNVPLHRAYTGDVYYTGGLRLPVSELKQAGAGAYRFYPTGYSGKMYLRGAAKTACYGIVYYSQGYVYLMNRSGGATGSKYNLTDGSPVVGETQTLFFDFIDGSALSTATKRSSKFYRKKQYVKVLEHESGDLITGDKLKIVDKEECPPVSSGNYEIIDGVITNARKVKEGDVLAWMRKYGDLTTTSGFSSAVKKWERRGFRLYYRALIDGKTPEYRNVRHNRKGPFTTITPVADRVTPADTPVGWYTDGETNGGGGADGKINGGGTEALIPKDTKKAFPFSFLAYDKVELMVTKMDKHGYIYPYIHGITSLLLETGLISVQPRNRKIADRL